MGTERGLVSGLKRMENGTHTPWSSPLVAGWAEIPASVRRRRAEWASWGEPVCGKAAR